MPIKRLSRKLDVVYCYVRTSSLLPSPWNPERRVTTRNLQDLRESMTEHGFLEFCPVVVDRNGQIVDGHRRQAAATYLRIEEIPVLIGDADAGELWALFNGKHKPVTGAQAMEAMSKGLNSPPPKFAKLFAKLEDVLGADYATQLSALDVSPHIYVPALRIARYCELEHDKIFLGNTILWLAKHRRMNTVAVAAIKAYMPASQLERAIRADRSLEPNGL